MFGGIVVDVVVVEFISDVVLLSDIVSDITFVVGGTVADADVVGNIVADAVIVGDIVVEAVVAGGIVFDAVCIFVVNRAVEGDIGVKEVIVDATNVDVWVILGDAEVFVAKDIIVDSLADDDADFDKVVVENDVLPIVVLVDIVVETTAVGGIVVVVV